MKRILSIVLITSLVACTYRLESMDVSEATQRLIGAISTKNVNAAEKAIKDGASLHSKVFQGLTALEYAQKKFQEAQSENWCYADMASQVLEVLNQNSKN
jgi:hypothetical protein